MLALLMTMPCARQLMGHGFVSEGNKKKQNKDWQPVQPLSFHSVQLRGNMTNLKNQLANKKLNVLQKRAW
jgi:hypothetical protein